MKTNSTEQNEMTIDDGDNLVSDAWTNLVQSSPALQRALQEQATAKFMEMSPSAIGMMSQMKARPDTSGFASLLG